jgi:hypothetical protein
MNGSLITLQIVDFSIWSIVAWTQSLPVEADVGSMINCKVANFFISLEIVSHIVQCHDSVILGVAVIAQGTKLELLRYLCDLIQVVTTGSVLVLVLFNGGKSSEFLAERTQQRSTF